MATIIIQGNSSECEKALKSLKEGFETVQKKTSVKTDSGITEIVNADLKRYETLRNYTDSEIMEAFYICSNKEPDCRICPMKKENDCKTNCIASAAIIIRRMLEENSANNVTRGE